MGAPRERDLSPIERGHDGERPRPREAPNERHPDRETPRSGDAPIETGEETSLSRGGGVGLCRSFFLVEHAG